MRAREPAWLDAYEHLDPEVMSDVLADGFAPVRSTPSFLITGADGNRTTRAQVIASVRRPPSGVVRVSHLTTRDTVALVRDGVVVLIGHVIATPVDPQGPLKEQVASYTDTWVREAGRWRVLASQLSRTAERPPETRP